MQVGFEVAGLRPAEAAAALGRLMAKQRGTEDMAGGRKPLQQRVRAGFVLELPPIEVRAAILFINPDDLRVDPLSCWCGCPWAAADRPCAQGSAALRRLERAVVGGRCGEGTGRQSDGGRHSDGLGGRANRSDDGHGDDGHGDGAGIGPPTIACVGRSHTRVSFRVEATTLCPAPSDRAALAAMGKRVLWQPVTLAGEGRHARCDNNAFVWLRSADLLAKMSMMMMIMMMQRSLRWWREPCSGATAV